MKDQGEGELATPSRCEALKEYVSKYPGDMVQAVIKSAKREMSLEASGVSRD